MVAEGSLVGRVNLSCLLGKVLRLSMTQGLAEYEGYLALLCYITGWGEKGKK